MYYKLLLLIWISCQTSIPWAGRLYGHIGTGIGKQVHAMIPQEHDLYMTGFSKMYDDEHEEEKTAVSQQYTEARIKINDKLLKIVATLEAEQAQMLAQCKDISDEKTLRAILEILEAKQTQVLAQFKEIIDQDKLLSVKRVNKKFQRQNVVPHKRHHSAPHLGRTIYDQDNKGLQDVAQEKNNLIESYLKWTTDAEAARLNYLFVMQNYLKRYSSHPPRRSTIKNFPLSVGLAYHFNTFLDCAVEFSYLNFSTFMKLQPPEYVDDPNSKAEPLLKNTFLHGIHTLGKLKFPILAKLKAYPQLGLGGFWGTTDRIDVMPAVVRIPLSGTLLLGGGIEYTISKQIILDCSWNYGMIRNINNFYLFKVSLAYRIY